MKILATAIYFISAMTVMGLIRSAGYDISSWQWWAVFVSLIVTNVSGQLSGKGKL